MKKRLRILRRDQLLQGEVPRTMSELQTAYSVGNTH